jgi:hypothetical protein
MEYSRPKSAAMVVQVGTVGLGRRSGAKVEVELKLRSQKVHINSNNPRSPKLLIKQLIPLLKVFST